MSTVKVGFSTSDWWVSRLIRADTHSTVSHTFLLVEGLAAPFDQLILEAAWCGWRLSTLDRLCTGSTHVVEWATPQLPLDKGLQLAMGWLGEPYNYTGIFGMPWVELGKIFGQRWGNPFPGVHHMFCSEAVTYVLQADDYPGAAALDPRAEDPEALRSFCRAAGMTMETATTAP